MSRTNVIVRPRDNSAGGRIEPIDIEGAFDAPEARAAIGLLHSENEVVEYGSSVYSRADLQRLIDGGSATPSTPPAAPASQPSPQGNVGEPIFVIEPMGNIPEGSRVTARLRNEQGILSDPIAQDVPVNRGTNTVIRVPPNTPYGRYTLEVTIVRPNMDPIHYNPTRELRPRIATLSNASVLPPSSGTSLARESMRVRFSTSMAGQHFVTARIGNHVEAIDVPAGAIAPGATTREYTATLPGEPRTWMDTGGTGRHTVPVTLTPRGNGRDGTPVNAGNVTITQLRRRGGRSTPRPTAPRVARPLP